MCTQNEKQITAKANESINFTLNGKEYTVLVVPGERLLDMLRNRLGLSGPKEGCGAGECGACTVIFNGINLNSCLIPAERADGAVITTIEGLSEGIEDELDPVQQSFLDHGAVQCGYCTPGMVLSAKVFLDNNKDTPVTRPMIKEALSGNLCRCTGYQKIVDAVYACAPIKGDPEEEEEV